MNEVPQEEDINVEVLFDDSIFADSSLSSCCCCCASCCCSAAVCEHTDEN